MNAPSLRARAARALIVFAAAMTAAAPVAAARIGILTNKFGTQTAADFNTNLAGHTFTAVDTAAAIPTLATLTNAFDAILIFEDATYGNAPSVGNVAAAFARTGRPVVLGTFYDQDRSDAPAANTPHGWGALEQHPFFKYTQPGQTDVNVATLAKDAQTALDDLIAQQ